jgi:hypothetical protein
MQIARPMILSCLLSGLCFACHAQTTPQPYESLNGNWRILPATVVSNPSSQPTSTEFGSLVLTMGEDGDRIYGEGELQMNCRNNWGLFVEGRVLPDGTFT